MEMVARRLERRKKKLHDIREYDWINEGMVNIPLQ